MTRGKEVGIALGIMLILSIGAAALIMISWRTAKAALAPSPTNNVAFTYTTTHTVPGHGEVAATNEVIITSEWPYIPSRHVIDWMIKNQGPCYLQGNLLYGTNKATYPLELYHGQQRTNAPR